MRNLFRVSADKYTAVAVSTGRDIKSASAASLIAKGKFATMMVMLTAMLAAILIPLGAAQQKPAEANIFKDAIQDIFCLDAAYFYEPEHYAEMGGSMGLVYPSATMIGTQVANAKAPNSKAWESTRHTAYEKYWMSGLNWTVYRGETDPAKTKVTTSTFGSKEVTDRAKEMKDGDPRSPEDMSCFPGVRLATTASANFIFMATKLATAVTGALTAYTFDTSWLNGLNETAEQAITGSNGSKGLRDSLYFQFLGLAVFIGSLHLIYVGLIKQRSMEAATSALWMVGAVFAGSLLMFNPSVVPDLSESIISEVNGAVLTGTTGTVTSGSSDELCKTTNKKDRQDRVISAVNCNFWRTFAYEPWVLGQYGAPSTKLASIDGQKAPTVSLGGGTNVASWPLYQLEAQSMDTYAATSGDNAIFDKKNNWFQVVDVVSGAAGKGDNTYFNTWAGYGFGRILVALSSLIAILCALVVVAVFGISSIAYTLGLAVLVGISPLFLLIGAHPGTGRRIAMEWVELVISTVLKRITLAAMLGLLLMFYSALMTSTSLGNWALQTLGIIGISVAFLIYRGTIMELMGRINLGGLNNFGDNEAGRKMGGVATGAAAGAAGALLGSRGVASEAMNRRPNAGRLGKAASVAGAVAGATAKGTAGGAYRGAHGYRPVGQGFRAGASAASATRGKIAAKATAAQAAAAAAANQQKQASATTKNAAVNPATRAAQIRKDASRKAAYAKDYANQKNNPEWREDFKAFYGFPPPNPEEKDFAGYGLPLEALRPHQMPQDKVETDLVDEKGNPIAPNIDTESEGANNADGANGEAGSDGSAAANEGAAGKHPSRTRPRATAKVPLAIPVGAEGQDAAGRPVSPDTLRPMTPEEEEAENSNAEGQNQATVVGTAVPRPNAPAGATGTGDSPQTSPQGGTATAPKPLGKDSRKTGNPRPRARVPHTVSSSPAGTEGQRVAPSAQGASSHPDATRPATGTAPQAASTGSATLPQPGASQQGTQPRPANSSAQAPQQPNAAVPQQTSRSTQAPQQPRQAHSPVQGNQTPTVIPVSQQSRQASSPAQAPQPSSSTTAPQQSHQANGSAQAPQPTSASAAPQPSRQSAGSSTQAPQQPRSAAASPAPQQPQRTSVPSQQTQAQPQSQPVAPAQPQSQPVQQQQRGVEPQSTTPPPTTRGVRKGATSRTTAKVSPPAMPQPTQRPSTSLPPPRNGGGRPRP